MDMGAGIGQKAHRCASMSGGAGQVGAIAEVQVPGEAAAMPGKALPFNDLKLRQPLWHGHCELDGTTFYTHYGQNSRH